MSKFVIPAGELAAANGYKAIITAAAAKYNLDPAVIAAVGSRETGWGTGSDMVPKGPAGTGDRAPRKPKPPLRPGPLPPDGLGYGRGLMQADWDWSDFARSDAWSDPASNIDFGCNELSGDIEGFKRKGLSAEQAEQAGIAAYNHGFQGVWKNIAGGDFTKVDDGTAHNNYSADVMTRADAYRLQGFSSGPAEAALVDAVVKETAMTGWPTEGSPAVDQIFGPIETGPDGMLVEGWEEEHLTRIQCPWPLTLSWDHSKTIGTILCNKQVADSLQKVLAAIWTAYGEDYPAIARARMHLYGGCFEFRRKRGLSGLSLHAYGAAIDFDPEGNPLYYPGAHVEIHMPSLVVDIFQTAGWKWGNTFNGRKDPMHFQATG